MIQISLSAGGSRAAPGLCENSTLFLSLIQSLWFFGDRANGRFSGQLWRRSCPWSHMCLSWIPILSQSFYHRWFRSSSFHGPSYWWSIVAGWWQLYVGRQGLSPQSLLISRCDNSAASWRSWTLCQGTLGRSFKFVKCAQRHRGWFSLSPEGSQSHRCCFWMSLRIGICGHMGSWRL